MTKKKTKAKKTKSSMEVREMMLLLDILMCDIRGDWDSKRGRILKDERVWRCLELIDELNRISVNTNHKMYNVLSCIPWDKFYANIGRYLTGRFEGRILRTSVSLGGYEAMHLYHRLTSNFSRRSKWFQRQVKKYCRTEYTFMKI